MQAARQRAFGADAALDAALHRLPNGVEAVVDFVVAAPCPFVLAHQLRDRDPAFLAARNQPVTTVERMCQFRGVGDDTIRRRFVRIHHETAPYRVVLALRQLVAVGIKGEKAHAVAVVGQLLALVPDEVALLVEVDGVLADQLDATTVADAGKDAVDGVGVNPIRPFAGKPEQYRLVGAVTAAGQRQRAEQLGAHAGDLIQAAFLVQPALHKARCSAHWPHRMRGRRANADLEDVEKADGHGGSGSGSESPYSMPPPTPCRAVCA